MSALPAPWLAKFPEVVRRLDTKRHALLEASAGTGKTYAIEHLVMRLLVEHPDWNPEEILLVSFAEKTAGDLRERIRAKLREQWPGSPEPDAKASAADWTENQEHVLRKAWMQADDLAVHTFHGFCHAALLRDPISNGTLIRPELQADRAMAEDALENLLRGPWARDAELLAGLREALKIKDGDHWRGKLIKLALDYHPWRGDRIEPQPDPDEVRRLEREADVHAENLLSSLKCLEFAAYSVSDFRASFAPGKTGQSELRKHGFERAFHIGREALALDGENRSALLLRELARKKTFVKTSAVMVRGWVACIPDPAKNLPEWVEFAEACAALQELNGTIEAARRRLLLGRQAEAAMQLRAELTREKIRRGVISYDDMLKDLAAAFEKDPGLAFRLRRRYKVCIVDEFQDTDILQWKILKALCLEAGKEGEAPLPLFLVGDPKQAIYGFRGGDLNTYLGARETFHALARRGEAQGFGLDRNFRSRAPLVAALNDVFAREEWFGAPSEVATDEAWHLPANSDTVSFTPARPGRETDTPASENPPVRLHDFTEWEGKSKPAAERELRRWIAATIRDLTHDAGDGRDPRFEYGDIAVLVRKNAEAIALERHLRRRGIPCRLQRHGGVFHGPAADALRILLDLIPRAADPGAQAQILLLPFLRRSDQDWPRGLPAQCPPLLSRWISLAFAGKWPEFFDSLLHEDGYLDRLAADSPSEAERVQTLARILAEAGSAPGVSAHALGDRFDALRRGEGDEDESGPDSGSASGGAVTLMTLHMSKGLEFPVVFIAAAGAGVKPDYFTLRGQESGGFRHVLDKQDAEAEAAHARQSLDEEKRLFYVGFTRARERLYVPLLPSGYKGGETGPLGGFAGSALLAAANASGQTRFILTNGRTPDFIAPPVRPVTNPETNGALNHEALAESTRAIFAGRRHLTSYSALARRAQELAAQTPLLSPEDLLEENGKRLARDEGDRANPGSEGTLPLESAPQTGIVTREQLPAGAATGNALHALLEHSDFASVLAAESPQAWMADSRRRDSFVEVLRRSGLGEIHADVAARLVWNTLRMPLPDPFEAGAFRLADLPRESDRRHEVEFLFPFNDGRGGFLWGFIDLVFRYRGRYYLLDWKSNTLDRYDESSIRESMEHHRYDLQYKLYSVALDKWLAARLPDYDPARHFGGVFYLYLRGAAPDRFSGFAHLPTVEDLRLNFPALLGRALGVRTEGTSA